MDMLARFSSALQLLLLALGWAHAGKISLNEELLIGWRGEVARPTELLYDPLEMRNLTDLPLQNLDVGNSDLFFSLGPVQIPLPASKGWIEHVSWKPRVFIWHNFITDEEARHLIDLAVPQMKRSTVVGPGGKSVEDGYRTSYGTFLRRYQDAIVERLENRVAAWTKIPVEHQEDTQILRYGIGQFYKVHADTLRDEQAGPRVATILIYLNEPEEGGETAFPDSQWINPELVKTYGDKFSECAKGHVGMRPKRGDALLFWSINPDGNSEDFHASHTGCPVIRGAKWTATKWVHAKPFRPQEMEAVIKNKGFVPRHHDPGVCEDTSNQCGEWAKNDGCEKNKDFMVVTVAGPGACRKTCGACEVCAPDDKECYNRNRANVGFLVHDPKEIK